MIPKVIHYCWFGRQRLPKLALKCIESWQKYLPEYEIMEWNEDNFDVESIQYTKDAYQARKFAFVSDYARFWILYHFGGIYFDTDVELITKIDDILSRGAFMGIECYAKDTVKIAVNPGLGMGAEPGMALYKRILDEYKRLSFWKSPSVRNPYSMIPMVTDMLTQQGLIDTPSIQFICDVNVYPKDYFNPLNDATGRLCITDNTRSIHWYMKSWMPHFSVLYSKIMRCVRRVIGIRGTNMLKKLLK